MSRTRPPSTSANATARTRRTRTSAPAQAQDAQEEGREEDLDSHDQDRSGDDSESFVRERAEAVRDPRREDQPTDDEAHEHERTTQKKPVLEPEARAHAIEPGVRLVHEIGAVGVR